METNTVQSQYKIVLDWTQKGKEKFTKNILSIFIDDSGSTNNNWGRGRGRFNTETSTDNKTKFIFVAEMEGVVNILNIIHMKYDLTNINLQLKMFSDSVRTVFDRILSNPCEELEYLSRNFSSLFTPEFSGTHLYRALSENLSDNSMVIIATDGHPSDDNSEGEKCCTLFESYPNMTLIMVGAGSVKEQTGESSFCYRRGITNRESFLAMRQSNYSECNLNFMYNMCASVKESVYCPAFGDYSFLVKNIRNFLNESNEAQKYGVRIETAITPYPNEVNECLNSEKDVIYHCQYGSYLITKYFQVALNMIKPRYQGEYYTQPCISSLHNKTFEEVFYYSIDNITVDTNTISIAKDTNGFCRCRKVVEI